MREQATMREEATQPTCHMATRWRRGELTEAEVTATTEGRVFLQHMRAIGRHPKSQRQQSHATAGVRSGSGITLEQARARTRILEAELSR